LSGDRLAPNPIAALRGGLVVSVQASSERDPMCDPVVMALVAMAAVGAGAVGIRCGGVGGPDHVRAVREAVDVPIIGLWKVGSAEVRITPTVSAALAIAAAGADIVAVDATDRQRSHGGTLAQVIHAIHDAGCLVMADVASVDEGLAAVTLGADLVATTLAGYTSGGSPPDEPDLTLVGDLAARVPTPVVAEGRFHDPAQARRALELGAHTVVVGSAITSPGWITTRFVAAMADRAGQ
jgi:N-acylglucosamine-6-phosphate 2-epimerase